MAPVAFDFLTELGAVFCVINLFGLVLLLGSELSEKTVRRKIADAFEKLRGVGVAREELQQFRYMDVFDRCRETGLKNVPGRTTWPIYLSARRSVNLSVCLDLFVARDICVCQCRLSSVSLPVFF